MTYIVNRPSHFNDIHIFSCVASLNVLKNVYFNASASNAKNNGKCLNFTACMFDGLCIAQLCRGIAYCAILCARH